MSAQKAGAVSDPPILNLSNRLRRSPIFDRVKGAGAKAWSVYNRTVIGQWFRSLEEDYAHLKSAVQVWDVGGERVVEVSGPDAQRLIQMTTPRDLGRLTENRCAYVPMVDRTGGMLNDPVLVRLSPDRYWLAQADGDARLYLKGLAEGLALDVSIFEPDVWPLAIQGPKAEVLAARVFEMDLTEVPFFGFKWVAVAGRPMVVARSGWSAQGGFEIYVDGAENEGPLWDRLMEAGEDLDVRAGCPNLIERIEAGLLSYGNDMGLEHTPFEAGLGRYCHLAEDRGCLAHGALVAASQPARQVRPMEIEGAKVPAVASPWPLIAEDGAAAGVVSSAAWSPDQATNVAIAMVGVEHWEVGTEFSVRAPDGWRTARVAPGFWGCR